MQPPDAPATAREPRLWVLNLDAEIELQSAGPYQTPLRVAQALAPWLERARVLLAPGDEIIGAHSAPPVGSPRRLGAAWCPTPSALQRLAKAGARVPPSPSLDVLRRVNQRRFYLGLGGGAPGAQYFDESEPLEAALSARGAVPWLFKRAYGFAGRGQRRIPSTPSADDRRWLADSLRQDGLLGEPWVEIERELCLHGMLDETGGLTLGRICVQRTDAQRAWVASELAAPGEVDEAHARTFYDTAARVAEALTRAGYFGPFGLDGYVWKTPQGSLAFNPLGELNARYTMGFAIGLGVPGA
jgi:hypothetical protein